MAEVGPIRIGDEDRERVIARINSAYGQGRLELGELEQRLALAHRAKLPSDLEPLIGDLPQRTDDSQFQPVPSQAPECKRPRRVDVIGPFFIAPVICTVIYAIVGFGDYFWPIWVWFGCMIPVVLHLVFGDD